MRELGHHALFDESGTERDEKVCIVGGFFGTVKQWKRFEHLWAPNAKSPGFHAKRFFARDKKGERVKPYRGWSNAQAERYLVKLLKAIETANIQPVASMIDLDAFWSFNFEERHQLTGAHWRDHKLKLSGAPNRPYYLPFQQVVLDSLDQSSKELGVYFSFDENEILERHARQVYQRIKSSAVVEEPSLAERMKGITFESDLDNIGLQASDLLVYSWHDHVTRAEAMRPELHMAFNVFKQKQRGDELRFFTQDTMEKLLGKKPLTTGRTYTTESFRPGIRK
jgi:Protein of unknown function (DUF3800)